MKKRKNILICPLNWGLGHATRCVAVIRELIAADVNVIIAADKRPLAFLKNEFPDLPFINFPGYEITYQKKGSFALKMLLILPEILKGIYDEHKLLKEIIEKYSIDIVISDNRFGLWNKKIKSIFITHQILIKSPVKSDFIEKFLFSFNKIFIKNYDECWIPDLKGEKNLSGDLSHKYKLPIDSYFIGPISRFKNTGNKANTQDIDLLVILSGPEPQRSIFEKLVLQELSEKQLKSVMVRGVPEENNNSEEKHGNLTIYPHLSTDIFQEMIDKSRLILCRSGYSTIMDLAVWGKKAILVPTPGQTEQEYLANYYLAEKYFYSVSQRKFNLEEALSNSDNYTGIRIENNNQILKERIFSLLNC